MLSTPFQMNRPFPLTTLFCLAEVERIQGQLSLVWQLDHEGRPVVPDSGGTDGAY